MMMRCMICVPHQIFNPDDQTKENDLCRACGMCREEEYCLQGFGDDTA
jgi:hypothetical protein